MRKKALYLVLFLFALTSVAHAATAKKIVPLKGTWNVTLNDSSVVTWEILTKDYVSSSGSSQIGYGIKNPGNVEFVIFFSGFMQAGYDAKNRYLYIEKAHADVVDYNDLPNVSLEELNNYYTTFLPVDDTEDDFSCFTKFTTEAGGLYPIKSGVRTSICEPDEPPCTGDNCTEPCAATKVLGADNPELQQLRNFRDSALAQTFIGKKIINIYYSNSASINAALDRSAALQAVARNVFKAAALLNK